MLRAIPRIVVSAGLIATLLVVYSRLPDVDRATVASLMVVAIVGLASMWGRAEALTGAIIGVSVSTITSCLPTDSA